MLTSFLFAPHLKIKMFDSFASVPNNSFIIIFGIQFPITFTHHNSSLSSYGLIFSLSSYHESFSHMVYISWSCKSTVRISHSQCSWKIHYGIIILLLIHISISFKIWYSFINVSNTRNLFPEFIFISLFQNAYPAFSTQLFWHIYICRLLPGKIHISLINKDRYYI